MNSMRNIAKQKSSPTRRAIIAVRWTLVATWACLVLLAPFSSTSVTGAIVQAGVFAVFGFLLVNALWQHMSLKSSCAMALIVVCLAISGSEVIRTFVLVQLPPDSLVIGLCGSVVGVLVARPVLKRIDRITGSA